MRPFDPYRSRGFEAFRSAYKPHVRPEDYLDALRGAFGVDTAFQHEFRLLRPHLRAAQREWPERIVQHLLHFNAIRDSFSKDDLARLAQTYRRHAAQFSSGNFDEAYLDSVEDVALNFLYNDVRSVWLAGAYGRLEAEVVDTIFETAGRKLHDMPVRRVMRALSCGMTLELSQIQRVFVMYERAVAAAALSENGALTVE